MTDAVKHQRLRAVVHGKVQRVNFRVWTEHEARALGLVGWVRNLSSGRSVEVLAEGPRRELEDLLTFLHQGPPYALVSAVDAEWTQAEGGLLAPFRAR